MTLAAAISALQLRKSWFLKHLTQIEAFTADEDAMGPQYLELWFTNSSFTSETKLAVQVEGAALKEIIGAIYLFCK